MDAAAFRKLSGKILPVLVLCIETALLGYWLGHKNFPTFVTVDIRPFVHQKAEWLAEQRTGAQELQQQLETFRKKLIEDLTTFAKSNRYLIATQGMLTGDLKDVTEDFKRFRGEIEWQVFLESRLKK